MPKFNSIIVFDTETTGLPCFESNKTRITELAFYGCEVEHLKSTKIFPRVLHKLVLCFNPLKVIYPDSSQLTGLDNELLMNSKPFNRDDVEIIKHFIERLPPPVCIVAHNGNKFDFPILQNHLHKLNCSLSDDIYCADSLKAFKEIYPKSDTFNSDSNSKTTEVQPKNMQQENETTPIKQLFKNYSERPSAEEAGKVRRQLFSSQTSKDSNELLSNSEDGFNLVKYNKTDTEQSLSTPKCYSLSSVYEFLHKKAAPFSHKAEHDTIALLSCIIQCDKFLDWIYENAVAFNTIKPIL